MTMTATAPYQVIYRPNDGLRFYGGNRDAFYSRAPEMILSGGAECLAGETLIHDYRTGQGVSIADMNKDKIAPLVLTLFGLRQADVPFLKGKDRLFRITLDNGHSFLATSKHKVLSMSGWVYVGDLRISQSLPAYDEGHLLSIEEHAPSIPLQGAGSSLKKVQGSQSSCLVYCRPYDEQLPLAQEIVQCSVPSQAYVREYSHFDCAADDRGVLSKHSRPYQWFSHHSTARFFPADCVFQMQNVVSDWQGYTDEHALCLSQPGVQSPLGSIPAQSIDVQGHHFFDKHLFSCDPPLPNDTTFTATITSITLERIDDYYDMTVPCAGHYIVDGLVHHNSGKTFSLCWKYHILALKYPGLRGLIVRKSQKSLYASVLRTWERVIAGAPVVIFGGSRPEVYNYKNGSQVWVGGMDNADKVLSSEWDWIYVNQAEELRIDDWEKLLTRSTGRGAVMPYTQLGGDCNPGGRLHWIRQRAGAGRLILLASSIRDNPTLYDQATGEITEQGKRSLAALESLTGVRRQRLLLGQWATAEGAVYEAFSVDVHVRERDAGEFTRWSLAVDEGYTNPAVILLVGEDPDGRLHIAREFYQRGVLQSRFVAECVKWCGENDVYTVIVDQAAAGLIADLKDAGLPAYGHKGRVLDGIQKVQDLLGLAGDGKPRLTIDPACTETINEFESYIWKPEKDEPVKENDHAMDALRYLVSSGGGVSAYDLIAAV